MLEKLYGGSKTIPPHAKRVVSLPKTMKPVHHIKIKSKMTVSELVKEMESTNVVGSGRLGKAVSILEQMIKDKDCIIFLGIAGAMVPSGMREIMLDILESRYIDVFVTTGANLTHDLAESLGFSHYQGDENADDTGLYKRGLVRMYDSLMPAKVYEKMEDFFEKNWKYFESCTNIKKFLWTIGKLTPKRSLLKICYEKKIPVFCPAISDSGIGLMVWGRLAKGRRINVNAFDDMKEIIDIAWTCRKAGVIYLGGGVPKNYIQQSMQFSKGAYYGIQITTDREEYGGSSGAKLKEGISWGKLKERARYIDVSCDVTIALPLMWAAVKERIRIS